MLSRRSAAIAGVVLNAFLGLHSPPAHAATDAQHGPEDARFEDDFSSTFSEPFSPAIHATRLDYSEFDVPVAVTVLTQEDIRLAGFLEVSEIFRAVPGFRIVKIGDESRLGYHGTTVRQHRRMKVTIDGKSALFGDGAYVEFDRLPIDLEDIVKVTITRGPNGAAYGDNAFFASVDFETIGKDDPHGSGIRLGRGYNDRQKIGVVVNENLGGFNIAFSGGIEKDGGYQFQDSMRTPRNDGKELARMRFSVERELSPGTTWTLDASAYDSEHKIGNPTLVWTGEQTNDGQFFAVTNRRVLSDSSRLDWFISYNEQDEMLRNNGCITQDTVNGLLSVTDPVNHALILAATSFLPTILDVSPSDVCAFVDVGIDSDRTEFEIEFESRHGSLRYLAGGSASWVEARSDQRFAGMKQQQQTLRVFGEVAYTVDQFHLSAGVMSQDSDNVDDVRTAWRGAINWHLTPTQMLRYSITDSFRIPSLVETETFWTANIFVGRRREDPSLYSISVPLPLVTNDVRIESETIRSHAIGYFGTFAGSRATIDVKVFRETIDDPIEADVFYFSAPAVNSASYELRGAEAEFGFRVNERLRVAGHYSYLDNEADQAFERTLHGDHAGSVMAIYELGSGHSFTASYYSNSAISGNSYDRYDFVYNLNRQFGNNWLRAQLVFQHHVGGVDGISASLFDSSPDEGHFKHLNQAFLYVEYIW